jgi:catechol 2,3-dioxygenase-like lactoylglutathione lyase family enzyme
MDSSDADRPLDAIHHIALAVRNIDEAVAWYTKMFACRVVYQDETWAMLHFANIHLALVGGGLHPPHIGVMLPNAAEFGRLKPHRDGTKSVYLEDPFGNAVEILEQA